MRNLTKQTSQHYVYVQSILITAHIEPVYMLLGGSNLFRIAYALFQSVKLIFWSKVMKNYAGRQLTVWGTNYPNSRLASPIHEANIAPAEQPPATFTQNHDDKTS